MNQEQTTTMNDRLSTRKPMFYIAVFVMLIIFPAFISTVFAQDPTTKTVPAVQAPQALVTFYSNPITLAGGLPKHKAAAFKGRIYADTEQLAFLEPAHFITLTFTAGPHIFATSPWLTTKPILGDTISLHLAAGHHYYLEAGELNNWFGASRFILREVACTDAKQANLKAKPLEIVHLRPAGSPIAVSETVFPDCL